MTAWSGYHLFLVDVLADARGLVAGRVAADPVVPVGAVEVVDVFTGSSTNFSLPSFTRMSCFPMPRKPPTPITTPSTLPDLSSRISLMSPSFSFWSLYTFRPLSLDDRHLTQVLE